MIRVHLSIVLCVIFFFQEVVAEYKLLQVQAVSRHGVRERTGTNYIPKLPCSIFSRDQAITELGRQQNYFSGKDLRDTAEYATLFSGGKYNASNHIFKCTAEIKTITSTQSVFQGVFHNETYNDPKSLEFVTVPDYIPASIDYPLFAAAICDRKIVEVRSNANPQLTQEWSDKQEEYKSAFEAIYNETGFGPTAPGTPGSSTALTLNTIPRAAEQIILAYEHGFTHPSFQCVYSKQPKDLNKVAIDAATFRNKMQNRPYNTSAADGEIAKLQASPFFNSVIREFLTMTGKNTEGELKARSFIYISGDNANILGPIQLVGRESFGRAPFGSVFFFELYVDAAKTLPYVEADLLVKVGWRNFTNLYYNNTEDDDKDISQFQLVVPQGLVDYNKVEWYVEDLCGVGKSYCTIAELRSKIYTDDEWKTKCGIALDAYPDVNNTNSTNGTNDTNDTNDTSPNTNTNPKSEEGLNSSGKGLLVVVIVLAVLLIVAVVVAVVFVVRAQMRTSPTVSPSVGAEKYIRKSGDRSESQSESKSESEPNVEVEIEEDIS